jgi:DNA-binding CsgD family transcriptional regulator
MGSSRERTAGNFEGGADIGVRRIHDPDIVEWLVADLYEAAAGLLPWQRPLERMASMFGAWRVSLGTVGRRGGGVTSFAVAGPATLQATADYQRAFHAQDPRLAEVERTPVGRWVHCHERFDDRFVASSPFYQDFLIPSGGRYLSAVKVHEDDERMMILGVSRSAAVGPVPAGEWPLLERISRHLMRGMAIAAAMRATLSTWTAGHCLIDQLRHPILLVDPAGRVRLRNAAAARIVERGDTLLVRDGLLGCRLATDERRLRDALHRLFDQPESGARGGRRARVRSAGDRPRLVRVNGATPDAMLTVMMSLVREPHAPSREPVRGAVGHPGDGVQPSSPAAATVGCWALLVMHDLVHDGVEIDPMVFAQGFDLSPAEARVAAKMASGMTVEKIAAENGVAVATVRSQVKSMLAKTGTKRQVDLVCLLTSLPDLQTLAGPLGLEPA